MRLPKLFRIKKTRKYPVLYHEGKSLRARCFELFDEKMRPSEVEKELGAKRSTVREYFRQWKEEGPRFKKALAFMKNSFRPSAPDREKTMGMFTKALRISNEEFEAALAKSHGLRRLLTGKLIFPGHVRSDHKRFVALRMGLDIANYLMESGATFEDFRFAFDKWLKESAGRRSREDTGVKEQNLETEMTRAILEGAARAEAEGRLRRDHLTGEEQAAVIQYGIQAALDQKLRSVEAEYWLNVAGRMASGNLTVAQAEEQIISDLKARGDSRGEELMRKYQDSIHGRKLPDQAKQPSPPSQPQSPPPQPQPPA